MGLIGSIFGNNPPPPPPSPPASPPPPPASDPSSGPTTPPSSPPAVPPNSGAQGGDNDGGGQSQSQPQPSTPPSPPASQASQLAAQEAGAGASNSGRRSAEVYRSDSSIRQTPAEAAPAPDRGDRGGLRPTDTVRSSDGRETARSQTERALAVYREQAAALAEMETRQRSDPAFDFADDSLAIRQQLIATIA